VVIHADGSVSVEDDGRGIPVGFLPEYNMNALELCLTQVGAGGKFDRNSYKVSAGLHGVGVSAVNALSEWLHAAVTREGKVWTMSFSRGRTTEPLKELGEKSGSGTRIHFKADAQIFGNIEFSYEVLMKRLRELAYLNSGVKISLRDERENKEEI